MLVTRPLDETDFDAAWQLSQLAFGAPRRRREPAEGPRLGDGVNRWGAFSDDGRLVAKASDIEHEQWWGGRLVPASGVAGVAVQAEARGRGAGRSVMTALLHGVRERGAAIAALFCTSTAVYRSLGFEACGVLRRVHVPTALLPGRFPESIRLRAGTGRDLPAVRGVYDEIARTGNGLLSRRGTPFPDPDGDDLPEGLDGVTLAEDADGRVVGYATWVRGEGYGDDTVVAVPDCLALTPDAADALLASLSGWRSVAPTIRFRLLPWVDAVAVRLPLERAREHRVDVWMHRPVDVVAATAARGWPAATTGSVEFRLTDELLSANAGAWRLTLDAGTGALERSAGDPPAVLSVRGWSLLWSGAARCAQLRQAGLLTGPVDDDPALDGLLGGGGPSGLLDYF
jgi:predicted acetyltransferase